MKKSENTKNNEPDFIDMKKELLKIGGLLYQYRPCKRDYATIYDIENIKNGVVYSQTPLNMNDPFDSNIGFSTDKIYGECITLMLEAVQIEDDNLKSIISIMLKYKLLGEFAELISIFNDIKSIINKTQISMHLNNIPTDIFFSKSSNKIYKKLPKKIKDLLSYNIFYYIGNMVLKINDTIITEENISEFLNMDSILDELYNTINNLKTNTYFPRFKEFLSTLTISCFSSSGWNNQLMWAHYANSYSGICVEYDFSKMNDFIGFIYPVKYSNTRPNVSLKDLGIDTQLLKFNNNYKQNEIDISSIFNYLLTKNTCWSYEKEWRIINIGKANSPIFINTPFIKSITFGLNIDSLCKKLLQDICQEQNITCYELYINSENFSLDRKTVVSEDFDSDKELEYIELLSTQTVELLNKIGLTADTFNESAGNKIFDKMSFSETLKHTINFLSLAYFFKTSINRYFDNTNEVIYDSDDNEIINAIVSINHFIETISNTAINLKDALILNLNNYNITKSYYIESNKALETINTLIEKYNTINWTDKIIFNKN